MNIKLTLALVALAAGLSPLANAIKPGCVIVGGVECCPTPQQPYCGLDEHSPETPMNWSGLVNAR